MVRTRKRIDQILVEEKLAPSREKARQMIESGMVFAGGFRVEKPGTLISGKAIEVRGNENPYASRGGLKLEKALQVFEVLPEGMTALDAGASTGGFTDCLLRHGAAKVYAVDVGYGQLAWKLQQDPRVIRVERINIRYLEFSRIGEKVDLITADLSFISLTLVLKNLSRFLKEGGTMITLVKPQFEAGREEVGRGGIVRDPETRLQTVRKVIQYGETIGLSATGVEESPIAGQKGNIEFLVCFKPSISARKEFVH